MSLDVKRFWMTFIVASVLGLGGYFMHSDKIIVALAGLVFSGLGGILLGVRDDIIREEEWRRIFT